MNETSRFQRIATATSNASLSQPKRRVLLQYLVCGRSTTAQIELDVHLGHGTKFHALPLAARRKLAVLQLVEHFGRS